MKKLTGAVIVCLVMVLMAMPAGLFAQQMPLPVEKSIFPGVSTIQYAGQTFVFTTSAPLRVAFQATSMTEIEITVQTTGHRLPVSSSTTGGDSEQLVINWKNYNEDIYDGDPPAQPWTGILNTEGGWTEK